MKRLLIDFFPDGDMILVQHDTWARLMVESEVQGLTDLL